MAIEREIKINEFGLVRIGSQHHKCKGFQYNLNNTCALDQRTYARQLNKIHHLALVQEALHSLTTATPLPSSEGPYQTNWQSLAKHQNPEWLTDAKFGIFIHWLPNSVPAYHDEWYARWMYSENHDVIAHHKETWGDQKEFGYKDFIPMFKAENWDPVEWAQFFKSVGARYVVPNAEHHCHFAMWDSDLTKWDAMEMGPKRDIVGELAEAVRAEGMYYGVSNHRARGWNFFTYKPEYDTMDPEYADFYWPQLGKEPDQEWLTDWQARLHEVVDKYEPDMMWFDYGWVNPYFEPYKKAYTAYYYNEAAQRNQEVALIYKGDHLPKGAGVLDVERGKLDRIWPEVWMTDTTVFENTWGYVEGAKIKPANTLLHDLIDIVSKNGVLLLNVGPKPDGTIPDDQRHVLIEIGKWLDQNGECIYGTRPFDVYKEGDDIRFTRKGDAVYAIFLKQPSGQIDLTTFSHTSLGSFSIQSVELLSNGQVLDFTSEAAALQIQFPSHLEGERAWVAKVTLSGIGYSAPKVKITQGVSGGQVTAHGTVYNFTDEVQSIETNFYANRHRMGGIRRVLLQPGESGDIQFEHRDQNHYGAQDMILPNIEHAVYDFSFGQKKAGMSPITTRAFPAISLKGAWLFNPDADKPEFSEFAYDDSKWAKKFVPGRALSDPKTVGWFRKHVPISEAWKGRDLFMNLGSISDADTVYVNGHKVGEKGVEYVEFHFSREIRKFNVPAEYVNYGGQNVIAVRVYNEDRYGGLVGPAGFIALQEE